jgi:Holliday junction resolvasome RuvABC endonuclease subunit
MYYAGIDYSLTSPAICITRDFSEQTTRYYYLTSKKKYDGKFMGGKCQGSLAFPYSSQEERFDNISNWVMAVLSDYEIEHVYIEDYAMGAKGRVFHIGENTGLLQHKLWRDKYSFTKIAPTVVKKHATGKGNAKKEQMYDAFIERFGGNLIEEFSQNKLDNPVTDIIDAFYIVETGVCSSES